MSLDRVFQTVIMQPTTLCNLDCAYCYLSSGDRKARREMPRSVARAVARSIEEQGASGPVDLVWHGGEPLALGRERFAELCGVFGSLTRSGAVRQFVQTNATLIDDAWCGVFQGHRIHVGVSLDGPEDANAGRVDWSGREAFSRAMRGITTLKRNGVPFSAICVVTAETVRQPDRLFEFFESLGAESVGFNFEETEGANDARDSVSSADARRFWRTLFARLDSGSLLRSRDAGRLFAYLAQARAGRTDPQADVRHDPIPTVAWNGDTVVLSPELSGVASEQYGNFVVGNVLRASLPAVVEKASNARYVREFLHGVESCRTTCEFFDFCRGGQAGNKYFELGGFTGTETRYCQTGKQELVLALRDYAEVGR